MPGLLPLTPRRRVCTSLWVGGSLHARGSLTPLFRVLPPTHGLLGGLLGRREERLRGELAVWCVMGAEGGRRNQHARV
jgi:hypothetical protein